MSSRDPEEFSPRQWPDWSFWDENPKGGFRGRVATVVLHGLALLLLVLRVAGTVDGSGNPLLNVVVIALTACYVVGCLYALWYGPVAPRRRRIAYVVTIFAFGTALALVVGSPDYLTDLTYAIAIGLMLLPLRYSALLGVGTAVVQIGWMWLAHGEVNWGQVITLLGVTTVLGTVLALTFTIGHLRTAREQVRTLAVHQERERVARDLHDVLGHSLSTMTVKLGLARRILESTGDIAPAVAEIHDLESLSRQALSDVRATVSDYRTVSLATEIAGAQMALRAAGVRADLPATTDDVQPDLRGAFGYVVREAVTNILRHSDAECCRIRLGRDWVEITDNGSVGAEATAGHGLTGLTERMAAMSGTLDHGPAPGGGFRVVARGPAGAHPLAPSPGAHPT